MDKSKLILDKNHVSAVSEYLIYSNAPNTIFMIPSLITIRLNNDSYIHAEHLGMHDGVQRSMFNIWLNIMNKKKDINV